MSDLPLKQHHCNSNRFWGSGSKVFMTICLGRLPKRSEGQCALISHVYNDQVFWEWMLFSPSDTMETISVQLLSENSINYAQTNTWGPLYENSPAEFTWTMFVLKHSKLAHHCELNLSQPIMTDTSGHLTVCKHTAPDLPYNPHLLSNSCLLWPRYLLRRTDTQLWSHRRMSFGFITEEQIIHFVCIDFWHPLSLTVRCVGV